MGSGPVVRSHERPCSADSRRPRGGCSTALSIGDRRRRVVGAKAGPLPPAERGYRFVVFGRVRFFQSRVGARIAYATAGTGPPLLMLPPWACHLEAMEQLSGTRPTLEVLARQHTLVWYDRWGTGLSDRTREDFSIDADLQVLEDLVQHLHLRRAAVFSPSHGGPMAIELALRHPALVSHLVLYATSGRALTDSVAWPAIRDLILGDWEMAKRAVAAVVVAGAPRSDLDAFEELMERAATPEMMVALQDMAMGHDMRDRLSDLRAPTLVLHRRGDMALPVEEGRALAAAIPDAVFEVLEGEAHVNFVGDSVGVAERIVAFTAPGTCQTTPLTAREHEILELIASGSSNAEAADHLVLSVRTVERHLLNAYRKLGVRSRAEAAAAVSRRTA